MSKTIALVGALDTKGKEYHFVKELIESAGIRTLVIDFGVMNPPEFEPDITRQQVCDAASGDLDKLSSGKYKDDAMRVMSQGLAVTIRQLYDQEKFDGIFGMGGTGGTSIITTAMRELPVGFPKLMLSTVGGGDVSNYAGTKDITFMPSIVDVAGLNSISRSIYTNAAGAIIGMVQIEKSTSEEKPLIAASMFGNTTEAVDHARGILEEAGYEVLVFHATGTGGRTMEGLIKDGHINASLDITTTELADYVCGGVFDAGPERVMGASEAGIPAVVVPGCVDMANFGGIETVPEKYRHRNLYQWNPNVTLLRTNEEENEQIGKLIASAVNKSNAPVTIFLPLRGVSMLDSEGERFWDPAADRACFDAIKSNVNKNVKIVEIDANINDQKFSSEVAKALINLLTK